MFLYTYVRWCAQVKTPKDRNGELAAKESKGADFIAGVHCFKSVAISANRVSEKQCEIDLCRESGEARESRINEACWAAAI